MIAKTRAATCIEPALRAYRLLSEQKFEYDRSMELGDHLSDRAERPPVDVALDKLNTGLSELVDLIEAGGLDQFDAAETTASWQRFEAFRNRLPLIDHRMIADAEATDLAGSYDFTNMGRFLTRILQLSAGEAASRVRAAAAVGPRSSMLGEHLEPMLPRLAALQREGSVSAEKVQIVEGHAPTVPYRLGASSGADRRAAADRLCATARSGRSAALCASGCGCG